MKRILCLLFILLFAYSFGELPPSIEGKLELHVEKSRIIDQDGRERIFHGTNIVVKESPYYPKELKSFDAQFSFCEEDLNLLESMGYNSIRLSVPWAGVEPQDGYINQTYLDIMSGIVDRSGKHGIYSLVDFHQDAWTAKFCGNGVPDWAAIANADDFPFPLSSKVPVDPSSGYPTRAVCDEINNNNWSAFYLSYATSTAIGNLYDNFKNLRDRFANYWRKTASHFSSNIFVIGYELMNEPFAGNIYSDPLLLVPGVADRMKLQPLYDQINQAIRESDATHLVFFQGVTWEVVLPLGEKYGFERVPGGAPYANRSVLSWHSSVLPQVTPDAEYFSWKASEMSRLSAGGWVTETNDGGLDLLDQFQLSWMHWDYKWFANRTWDNPGLFITDGPYRPCRDRGNMTACLDTKQVAVWARVYAKAVAGTTHSFAFNASTRVAVLQYVINPVCALPTVLFASERWTYTDGFDVEIEPAALAQWSGAYRDHVVITHTAPVRAVSVTVTVRPTVGARTAGPKRRGDVNY